MCSSDLYSGIKVVNTTMTWPSHEVCLFYRKGSIQLPVIETFMRAVRTAAQQVSAAAREKFLST